MPKTKDYKKLAEKLQKELDDLKKQLKVQFQKGVDYAHTKMEKLHVAYDKHMQKAEDLFHKKLKIKTKKAAPKKAATKKSAAKTAKKTVKEPSKKKTARTSKKPARKTTTKAKVKKPVEKKAEK